jgi:hypothetical protein
MRVLLALLATGALAGCGSDSTTGPGNAPPAPTDLTSTSLDGAVALTWSDNAFEADPGNFSSYIVYSTSYDLDQDQCGTSWSIEGTTVAPEFIVGAMTNGVSRCFEVTASSPSAAESGPSPVRNDTPRPDARNVVVFARQAQNAGSGFSFWQDLNSSGSVNANELGLVLDGTDASADFTVERDINGTLFLTPARAGVTVALYGSVAVEDLTSIDIAPLSGFDASGLEALPGWGYVFEMPGTQFVQYGAVRVTHVGQNFLILDWAYQTDPGNPELVVGRK